MAETNDIIALLPDSVANQIAAGEVIQRPASVVKELVENAVDAGATEVTVCVQDAGRTLIQVIDNGKGMSCTDARMAFERHATSKIRQAGDLFSLHSKGFRGEALASVAAIARVELATRRLEDEVGTKITIAGSSVESQEPVSCAVGSCFSVKNIFFNVPARRKFLKSNQTELSNIVSEFERIVLVHPGIAFVLRHNDTDLFNLPASNLRQRIVAVFGKTLNQQLLTVEVETSLVTLRGYIGRPESARKRGALQYLFVNDRYMRHPYFHKAVLHNYEPLVSPGEQPNYFLYLTVDPATIDVNIHPTKTEIKFENEQPIWQILSAAVKEALGKFNAVPSIDFDTTDAPDIPIYTSDRTLVAPPTSSGRSYNPFRSGAGLAREVTQDWQRLYAGFQQEAKPDVAGEMLFPSALNDSEEIPAERGTPSAESVLPGTEPTVSGGDCFQLKGRYIFTPVKSGILCIDQHRAHIRILFDRYTAAVRSGGVSSQRLLFPQMLQLTASEELLYEALSETVARMGFDLSPLGNRSYAVNGIPGGSEGIDTGETLRQMLARAAEEGDPESDRQEALALSLARSVAIPYGQLLSAVEMETLIDDLFASPTPNYTPDGKPVLSLLSDEELAKRFR